jgi:predicted membrane channel-forming protein YqfA (hemolysin III family)
MLQIVLIALGIYYVIPGVLILLSPDFLLKSTGMFTSAVNAREMFILTVATLLTALIGVFMLVCAKKGPELQKAAALLAIGAAALQVFMDGWFMAPLGSPALLQSDIVVQGMAAILLGAAVLKKGGPAKKGKK